MTPFIWPKVSTGHYEYPLNDVSCAIEAALCPGERIIYDDFIKNHKCDKKVGMDFTTYNRWRWEVQGTGLGSSTKIVCGCGLVVNISEGCPPEHM